jgi:hypothetical protein
MLFLSLISPLASNYLSYVPAVFTTKMEAKYCHTPLASMDLWDFLRIIIKLNGLSPNNSNRIPIHHHHQNIYQHIHRYMTYDIISLILSHIKSHNLYKHSCLSCFNFRSRNLPRLNTIEQSSTVGVGRDCREDQLRVYDNHKVRMGKFTFDTLRFIANTLDSIFICTTGSS